MSLPIRDSNASIDEAGANFRVRQRQYFNRLIRHKWQCDKPGHGVCVPTDDGQHWKLSDRHIEAWIDFLVEDKGTTAEPPPGTFEDIGHGAVWNRKTGKMTVQAVSVSPVRRHLSSESSTMRWSMTTDTSSQTAVGPGSLLSKALRWIGQLGLDAVGQAAFTIQGREHIACFKTWQSKRSFQVGEREIYRVSAMLEDALVMATPYYPRRANMIAYEIGREAQNWLNNIPDLPQTRDNRLLLLRVNVCLIPLILVRISENEPFAGDLAWELIYNLTRIPLFLLDDTSDTPVSGRKLEEREDTAAIAIRIVAEELAYSKCSRQHSWLGVQLLSIVETISKIRPLSKSELTAINELALRRKAQAQVNGANDSRSWEVALFAHCFNQAPRLKEAVLQPTGLQYLIESLEMNFENLAHTDSIPWEDAIITLRSLSFLTQHNWVVESDVINRRALLAVMGIFNRDIPERRLPLHYWATDILHNIVARRPALVPVLIDVNILPVLSRIIPPFSTPSFSTPELNRVVSPLSLTSSHHLAPSNNAHERARSDTLGSHDSRLRPPVRRNTGSYLVANLMSRAQGKRLDIYRRAARKRAEELDRYIREYMNVTPDTLPRLNPAPAEDIWEFML